MTCVRVVGAGHGDGWLQVDTQEWINERGEYADDLTDDLREWMNDCGHAWAHDDVLSMWVKERTGHASAGLYGDGESWHLALFNEGDHLLSDELGFVVFSAGDLGELMIVVSDSGGGYVWPEVYRSTVMDLASWADYARACGECVNGHQWLTEDTVRLHREDSWDSTTYRVPDQVRVPFGDADRAYVACPECGKAVRFGTY